MPQGLLNHIQQMNGSDCIFVIQKKLFKSDVEKSENRLTIPVRQVKNKFLRMEEEEKLEIKEAIQVRVIEPCLDQSFLVLKKWALRTSCSYALVSGWFDVVSNKENKLMQHSIVRLWAFRIGLELCFALTVVDPEDQTDTSPISNNNGASTSHHSASSSNSPTT
ncbi:DUF313 domain-containing protein [Cephalotus follicularis]|uniref:DUF313 domain-containing protein n=1 Tax=Cephalotus follicularis TaxID=3775 RepID=A0A1Q3DIM2_CEPFO|nr:DUF313 domain-containing protein [Cephalotus follicularis]